MKSVFTIFLFIVSFVLISRSQTNISGNVNGVWTVNESPYIVTDNLILQSADTLTIQPGVEVRFDGNYRFDIFGTFFAIGTEIDSIKFTKNGDTKWMSLNFADACNDSSKIHYCIIEYGTSSGYEPYYAVLNCNSASPNISNSTFRYNEKVICNYGSDSKSLISKNIFNYNSGYAIDIEENSIPVIDSNLFINNSSSCIYINNSQYSIIVNNQFINNEGYNFRAIYLDQNCDYTKIYNNIISDNGGDGIYIYMKNKDITVSKNKISNNLGKGVILKVFNYALIEGNIIYNNDDGIYLENANYGNCIVVGNTIYGNSYGIYWTNVDNNYGLCLKNNSITNNSVGIRCVNGLFTNSITYNNCWNNISSNYSGDIPSGVGSYTNVNINGTVCDAYFNISENPKYTNADSCDFSLQLTSPNINAGDPDLDKDPDSTISDIGAIYFNQLPYLPIADFTSDIASGNPPLSIHFTDQSIESDFGITINSWSWDFGDGNTSNLQNPVHEYQNSGIYTVSLTITDSLGFSDTQIEQNYICAFLIEIKNLRLFGEQDVLHIVNHTPIITFEYFISEEVQQSYYHIQVSTDSTFSALDMWDSGEIASSDTSVIYDGQELQDGEIYYLRARVASRDLWSDWVKLQFKMNSKPSVPVLISPINNEVSNTPIILRVLNSTDAENDNLTYSFNVYGDATLTEEIDSIIEVLEATDTTSWQITATLTDNAQYWWTASASDEYEESIVSQSEVFTFTEKTSLKDNLQEIPADYSLSQNYPNPFNPTTTISYQLPKSSFVKLTIYDISGRLVDKLIDEKKNAGYYTVEWNAENVCSGVYFYRIEAGNFVAVKKGLLVK